jgi:integrase
MSLLSGVNVTGMVSKKQQLERFEQIPEVKGWLDGSDIKATTRAYYSKRLFEFLDGETPKQFLDRALKEPREVSIQIKGRIGKVVQSSPSVGVHTKAALRSFLEYYETQVHMNGKVKVRRRWSKPYLSWADAERIIAKCREPYESIFRFMLWSGLGQDEVIEINSNKETISSIEKQRTDPNRDYIIIDLEPRKQTLSRYFTAVPKMMVPHFPLKTLDYRVRGGIPVHVMAMEARYRKAAGQVGLYQKGMGPHTLRSVFTSQCAMVGVAQAVCEFVKGHGAGDKYGYSREVLNEKYAITELRKLQGPSVKDLETENRSLQERLERLEGQFESLTRQKAKP